MLELAGSAESRVSVVSALLLISFFFSLFSPSHSTHSIHSYVDTSYSYDTRSMTRMCYSCMSEDFLHHWSYLQELYYTPANFSDECYHIDHSTTRPGIGIVPCPAALCITVIEPKILAGQRIGSNIIRGCISGVFRHTHRMPPSSPHQADHECLSVSMRQLLPPHLASRSSNRSMNMCICSGQLCNDFPSISNGVTTNRFLITAISLVFLRLIN
ncbi:hypothetical protein PMAYCL1PPCAC_30496 [Pristionchus mayeri]|uniref:Uncharacterized protein n=1 Tax=Pristionchus mayeri TaxID=1317129 RepID=A0AAN5IF08_9BILA|nr:hypothetical protein PMAYCL1PPCAC_30496 [Pristionchus mayeri]